MAPYKHPEDFLRNMCLILMPFLYLKDDSLEYGSHRQGCAVARLIMGPSGIAARSIFPAWQDG